MPELPEVEVVRRGLVEFLTGRTVESVEVLHPRPVRRHAAGPEDFVSRLKGQVFAEPARRGKYLWLPLTSGDAVLTHLGMSGQFRVQPVGAPDEPHLRVRFRFADGGGEVRFVDQRMFGGLSYSEGGAELPAEIAHIARDPFDPLFDPEAAIAKIRRRRTGLKRALLDQTAVSGIGNIYADEALWRAKLHYARATETLKPLQIRAILEQAQAVMAEALTVGGTSFDALYVNVNGESGYFERGLNVYGQEGSPCPRDGRPIRREPFMNRSSYRCPKCQPVPRQVRW
ncbi:bifunctional DNA-formamidopyrimidine glycosylase/DNA-(apurinic or apyrimidinic site) lyase [Kribbella sp.]|uniref:bifunctional DNA-formamidopyrimidine glycosylase/DNA-(apurinic or apyrimidinic site) lyase n=1 Tax=Kribbella sp. TaxID=1871183 RepID=UPI002D7340BA|nr:bifunctional DNA-formamidopyrimidine glycosylase/DNA-(apurinic or apyrimidinic site) lyase [Kribbella sp.]HZX04324.1 bifunctional DNA-formamidopyrimidine glycosylase/DNA-(apurinic or apyrimidinic site) lyase [Kribbella sp.]